MKNKITVLLAIVLLASCSAPKYSYYFDHYSPAKKQLQRSNESPLSVDPQLLVASTSEQTILVQEANREIPVEVKKTELKLTKAEVRTLKHELKKEFKIYRAARRNINSIDASHAAGIDHDLKLAAIFGAIGVVGLILGNISTVFAIIGGIALIIGIVFFVMWLVRQ